MNVVGRVRREARRTVVAVTNAWLLFPPAEQIFESILNSAEGIAQQSARTAALAAASEKVWNDIADDPADEVPDRPAEQARGNRNSLRHVVWFPPLDVFCRIWIESCSLMELSKRSCLCCGVQ
jgi:hypothetical protein